MRSAALDPESSVESDGALLSWEQKREHRLVHGLEATPEQRLNWLEEAIRLAWETGALPRVRPR